MRLYRYMVRYHGDHHVIEYEIYIHDIDVTIRKRSNENTYGCTFILIGEVDYFEVNEVN